MRPRDLSKVFVCMYSYEYVAYTIWNPDTVPLLGRLYLWKNTFIHLVYSIHDTFDLYNVEPGENIKESRIYR